MKYITTKKSYSQHKGCQGKTARSEQYLQREPKTEKDEQKERNY